MGKGIQGKWKQKKIRDSDPYIVQKEVRAQKN